MRLFLPLLFIILLGSTIQAQDNSLTFSSGELQSVADRLSGNAQYWPVILELAEHNVPENTFYLTAEDLLILSNLSDLNTEFEAQRSRIKGLVESGAAIFAENELDDVQQMIANYQAAIKTGDIDKLFEIGQNLGSAIDHAEKVLQENRIADIEAQIERKQGIVERRQGLLGQWTNADRGDLLKQSDGIKTLEQSYASLSFSDGSALKVDPSTTAIIRRSRIDRLSENTDTEISLENGSVLARLSAAGKERSSYILNAGTSSTELRSRNFFAETDSSDTVKLTNYDGEASVNSNDVVITIGKNEGTIVERGKAPLPPRKLLPAPAIPWASSDTVISNDRFLFRFNVVAKASQYRIEYGADNNFSGNTNGRTVNDNQLLINNIPDGIIYVRVQAIDSLGLRGPFSNTVRILRSDDRKAPPVFINDSQNNIIFTLNSRKTLTGITEPSARLSVSGSEVSVSPSGKFSFTLTNLNDEHMIPVKVSDRSGNSSEKTFKVIRLQENKLFDINYTGATGTDTVVYSQNNISISGTAYPGLTFIIENNNFIKEVKTDMNGRWGATLYPTDGYLIIKVLNTGSSKEYFSRSVRIQSE
ncbi:FecR domain-containing protein [Balneola sp. MJW-20]|uniref:FecR domain-containing protein n=1 Tax=Gracilimonas aurantiaca TaxID=3234185 RepID=UPI0034652D83